MYRTRNPRLPGRPARVAAGAPGTAVTALLLAMSVAGCGSSDGNGTELSDDDASGPEAVDALPAPPAEQEEPPADAEPAPSEDDAPDPSSEDTGTAGDGTADAPSAEPGSAADEGAENAPDTPSPTEEGSEAPSGTPAAPEDGTADEPAAPPTSPEPPVAELPSAPPTAPEEVLSIEYSGYDAEIFWTRSTDDGWVMGYDVYRDGEIVAQMLDALSFYDDGLRPETSYTYAVAAVDDHGIRGEPSTVTFTTPADLPPEAGTANVAELQGGGSSVWQISDGLGTSAGLPSAGTCLYQNGAGSGVGVTDAWLPDRYDAYDLASLMWVNGEQVGGWLRSSTASTTTHAPFPVAGLTVLTEFHAVGSQPTLRNYTSFANDMPDDVAVIVNFATNFGSDGATRVVASSGGDLAFDREDRWVITDDYDGGGDPTNTTVFFGPGSPVSNTVFTGTSVFDCAGNQGLVARIDLSIPAGERRALMFFHSMSADEAGALGAVGQFDATPPFGSDLVEGLTEEELAEVANWTY